jgi:diaminohydroxyphosphoribosylaminopyrimidine deaminase/5-amino-6-(5-phosphoribosylamino)uracil reductase
MINDQYIAAMQRALVLAAQGQGRTGSNPVVGSVILDKTGAIIAEGFHAGGDHAEVVAIKNAAQIPEGATIIVTLEPCNHTGKTGPCTQAIIDAGIKRVVYAVSDPNPVAAGGQARLEAAGVEVIAGVLTSEARFVNRAWLMMIEAKRPLFIWKIAATLDGKTAASDGTSKWITGAEARAYVTTLRRQSDAILVGTGTALADDPELIPHDDLTQVNPLRVIVGNRELPATARAFDDRAETIHYRSHDVAALAQELAARGIKQVLIEAGATLGTALFKAELVDEILLIQAPTLLGSGAAFIGDIGVATLTDRRNLELLSTSQLGKDLLIHARVISKVAE